MHSVSNSVDPNVMMNKVSMVYLYSHEFHYSYKVLLCALSHGTIIVETQQYFSNTSHIQLEKLKTHLYHKRSGLNKNGPQWLIYLNASYLVHPTVLETLGDMSLLEEVCHWRCALGF